MEPGNALAIPLDVTGFFKEGHFAEVTEENSIASNIHLLLTTVLGEYTADPEYGCELWEHEFSTVDTTAVWMDRLAQRMKELVLAYERRLAQVEVKAEIEQAEFTHKPKGGGQVASRMKKRMRITLNARLVRTNERFRFEDAMLVAPFSLD